MLLRMRASVAFRSILVLLCFFTVPLAAQTLTVELQDFREPEPRAVIENILIPEFEALHPGVTVEVSFSSWDHYIDKYVTYYLADMMPDIINVGSAALGQFATQGMLYPLNEF